MRDPTGSLTGSNESLRFDIIESIRCTKYETKIPEGCENTAWDDQPNKSHRNLSWAEWREAPLTMGFYSSSCCERIFEFYLVFMSTGYFRKTTSSAMWSRSYIASDSKQIFEAHNLPRAINSAGRRFAEAAGSSTFSWRATTKQTFELDFQSFSNFLFSFYYFFIQTMYNNVCSMQKMNPKFKQISKHFLPHMIIAFEFNASTLKIDAVTNRYKTMESGDNPVIKKWLWPYRRPPQRQNEIWHEPLRELNSGPRPP